MPTRRSTKETRGKKPPSAATKKRRKAVREARAALLASAEKAKTTVDDLTKHHVLYNGEMPKPEDLAVWYESALQYHLYVAQRDAEHRKWKPKRERPEPVEQAKPGTLQ